MVPVISILPLMIIVRYILMKFILDLQMTDVDLDDRVTALEENSGGNSQNGNSFKLSKHAVAFEILSGLRF